MVRINANPFAAEFSEPGHARIEIITKPGSDTFHGGFRLNFNDEALNARNAFATFKAPLQTRSYGANFSGPLMRNRWGFFMEFRPSRAGRKRCDQRHHALARQFRGGPVHHDLARPDSHLQLRVPHRIPGYEKAHDRRGVSLHGEQRREPRRRRVRFARARFRPLDSRRQFEIIAHNYSFRARRERSAVAADPAAA